MCAHWEDSYCLELCPLLYFTGIIEWQSQWDLPWLKIIKIGVFLAYFIFLFVLVLSFIVSLTILILTMFDFYREPFLWWGHHILKVQILYLLLKSNQFAIDQFSKFSWPHVDQLGFLCYSILTNYLLTN